MMLEARALLWVGVYASLSTRALLLYRGWAAEGTGMGGEEGKDLCVVILNHLSASRAQGSEMYVGLARNAPPPSSSYLV